MRESKTRLPWQLGKLLQGYFDSIVDELLPDCWIDLIRKLDDRQGVDQKKDAGVASESKNC